MEGPSGVVGKGSEEELVMELPPGFRFHPTDEEIISHYLTPKVMNSRFSAVAVGEVDLNKCEPWDLPGKAKMGEKEWYFFCNRDRKYPTGMRTNRATNSGYWKATGKDKEIYKLGSSGCLIGMKKTLVFYKGRAPKGEKTNWVMHEYRLEGEFSYYKFQSKEEWVVSRVFHKAIKINPFALPTSTSPYENDPHLFEYCSNMSPLPPLVENPTPSSLINENDAIDRKSKVSSPPSIDEDGDNYLSYLSVHVEDHQPQNCSINPLACPNYDQMTDQSTLIKPSCLVNFSPQVQVPNNEYLHPGRIIRERYPIQTFANRAILRGLNEVGTSSEPEKQAKMEQLSSNQSMVSVSQETGISADMTVETSSKPSDRFYGLVNIDDPSLVGPNVPDGLDYLWDY